MSMEFDVVVQEGVTIVYLKGKLDGNAAPIAEEKIMPYVISGCRLVIALCKCDYVSSAGLRLLLMIAKQLSAEGGKWGIACASSEIRDVMEMTGFSNFFTNYGTVAEAIKALKGEAK
ncbi:MAG: anti-sigma factor antagonist [Candidatus Omnitrophota bacterium]